MVGVMMLTSKGTAGIAGGAFIVLASTITAVGHIPLAALALIVGIDRLLNEGRVFINVLGNAIGTIVIGKWENDFDAERAREVLAGQNRVQHRGRRGRRHRRERHRRPPSNEATRAAAASRHSTRPPTAAILRGSHRTTPGAHDLMARVLVTTDYLHPGDEVDALLRQHGHQVSYRPAAGPRDRRGSARPVRRYRRRDRGQRAGHRRDARPLPAELKVIARSGVGYDSIDVAAAAARGIRVCNTPGVNHDAVAELTIALMLMAARRLRARSTDGVRRAVAARSRTRTARRHPRPAGLRAQRTRRGPARVPRSE